MSFAKKGIFSDNSNVIKQFFLFFTHAHKPKFGIVFFLGGGGGGGIYFDLSLSHTFFPLPWQFCCPLNRPSFAWNWGWPTF